MTSNCVKQSLIIMTSNCSKLSLIIMTSNCGKLSLTHYMTSNRVELPPTHIISTISLLSITVVHSENVHKKADLSLNFTLWICISIPKKTKACQHNTYLAHIFIWKTAGNIKANQMQQVAPINAIRLPKSGITSTTSPVLITINSLTNVYK